MPGKSKHSSVWAAVSPLKEILANAPEPVPSPGASARGCVVLAVQAGGCLPKESPGAALSGISRFHAKALALPEAHWSSRWALERPPAQGGLLVHTLPRSHLCWPSRAKSSQAKRHLPSLGWVKKVSGTQQHWTQPAAGLHHHHGWLHTSLFMGAN